MRAAGLCANHLVDTSSPGNLNVAGFGTLLAVNKAKCVQRNGEILLFETGEALSKEEYSDWLAGQDA